jgi:hypothetical protein
MDLHYFENWIRIRIRVKSWIQISVKDKIQELSRLEMELWTLERRK